MKFDELPEDLQVKWWEYAQTKYTKRPLESLKHYELEALCWYYSRLMEGWDHEAPQSYEEALMWHQQYYNLTQARLELAKRNAAFAERGLREWEAKRHGNNHAP